MEVIGLDVLPLEGKNEASETGKGKTPLVNTERSKIKTHRGEGTRKTKVSPVVADLKRKKRRNFQKKRARQEASGR